MKYVEAFFTAYEKLQKQKNHGYIPEGIAHNKLELLCETEHSWIIRIMDLRGDDYVCVVNKHTETMKCLMC